MNIRNKSIVFAFFSVAFLGLFFSANAMKLLSVACSQWNNAYGAPARVEASADQRFIVTVSESGGFDILSFNEGALLSHIADKLKNVTKIKIFKAFKDLDIYFIAVLQFDGQQSKLTVWGYDFETNKSMFIYSFDTKDKQKITDFTIQNGQILQVCMFDESLVQPGWVRGVVDLADHTRNDIFVKATDIFEIDDIGQIFLTVEDYGVLDLENPNSRVKFFGFVGNGDILLKSAEANCFELFDKDLGLKNLTDFYDNPLKRATAETIKSCNNQAFLAAMYCLYPSEPKKNYNLRLYNYLGAMLHDLTFASGLKPCFFDVDRDNVLTMVFFVEQRFFIIKVLLNAFTVPLNPSRMHLDIKSGVCCLCERDVYEHAPVSRQLFNYDGGI